MVDEQYRGLLTDREKEILTGEGNVSASYESRVRTRIRNKIQKLSTDLNLLKEHQPELYQEFMENICND